jgi:hypothetical protein
MSDTTSLGTPLQTARKISPLRQRMIDDMTVRNMAPNTSALLPETGQLPRPVF